MSRKVSDKSPVKRYKAKAFNSDNWYDGFYFEMPRTTYCFKEDGDPEIYSYLVDYRMTDWGLPNEPTIVRIDPDTLEELD
jgi:hypothetical protein